jgi:hypothetical protein
VGFAPAKGPELTALVILDSPEGDHSGSRAAAVFARIVERSLVHLGVPRDEEEVVRFAKVWPQTEPILPAGAAAEVRDAAWSPSPTGSFAPDVLGLSARDALSRFVASGLVPEIEGTGFVVEQSPEPGSWLEPGIEARLILGEEAPNRGPGSGEPPRRIAPSGIRVATGFRPVIREASEEFR